MTVKELIRRYKKKNPYGYFFSKETMRHFGDSLPNYIVEDAGRYWELCRKMPVHYGLVSSVYFDKTTFEIYHPE